MFEVGFGMFGVMFFLVFAMFFAVFILILVKGLKQWNQNNHSPRLTVPVTVVSKRTRHSHHAGEHHHSSTSYYVTFQVESGDRMELHLGGSQFGLIVEGDKGLLTFQGTRFLDFQRQF